MKRCGVLAVVATITLAMTSVARACPADECEDLRVYWEPPAREEPSTWWEDRVVEPAYEPPPAPEPPMYEPAPAYGPPPTDEPAPAWSEPVVSIAPSADLIEAARVPEPEPRPTPIEVVPDREAMAEALGLHRVTEVWVEHTTTREGPVTTYSSRTEALAAGTYARLVARVGTGEPSPYDGVVLGGRTALRDGRPVAGEIYENYVWNGQDYVVNAYVFFQDDSELTRVLRIDAPPTVTPVVPPTAPTSAPVTDTGIGPLGPPPAPVAPVGPASVSPLIEDRPGPVTASAPSLPSAPALPSAPPTPRLVRAGIALAPQADPLDRVEVLRGRRIPLWIRATIDDVPARVTGWALLSGELISLGPVAATGDEPLVATWRSVTRPGTSFRVRVLASIDVPVEGRREVETSIEVVVRSPAIVQ